MINGQSAARCMTSPYTGFSQLNQCEVSSGKKRFNVKYPKFAERVAKL